MVLAANTMASTAAIWAIVIVAVVALAAWLVAIVLADRSQVRASGPEGAAGESRFVRTGAWAGGSVPGARVPEIPGEAEHEPIETTQAVPRPRAGDADRAERSNAGPGARDDEEPSR
jgi:hypothetical protein